MWIYLETKIDRPFKLRDLQPATALTECGHEWGVRLRTDGIQRRGKRKIIENRMPLVHSECHLLGYIFFFSGMDQFVGRSVVP